MKGEPSFLSVYFMIQYWYSLGYDAAVCVETIEPWVVDAYNTTAGRATTFKIVGNGGLSTLPFDYGKRQGTPISVPLNSTLNSTGKFVPFAVAYDSSRNQILKVSLYKCGTNDSLTYSTV
jgi:hypothetical protein